MSLASEVERLSDSPARRATHQQDTRFGWLTIRLPGMRFDGLLDHNNAQTSGACADLLCTLAQRKGKMLAKRINSA